MTGKKIQNSSEDRLLPIANVGRIMKKSLPSNAKISKEAKKTVQECVSEFISFITGEASDKCQTEKRKTINGDDLLWAMTTLGFENYVGPLKVHLNKYRDNVEADDSTVITQRHSPASDDDTGKITDNLDGFNNGFQAQVSAKGRGDNYNLNFGYGDNLASGGFDITKSYEIDGNVKGIVATDIHHGIQW